MSVVERIHSKLAHLKQTDQLVQFGDPETFELSRAAMAYVGAARGIEGQGLTWSLAPGTWKPEANSVENLIKAAAYLVAEIEKQESLNIS